MYIHVFVCVCECFTLFATLRILFIYLPFSIRYGKKCFSSLAGKRFDSVVQLRFIFYSFMLLVKNS